MRLEGVLCFHPSMGSISGSYFFISWYSRSSLRFHFEVRLGAGQSEVENNGTMNISKCGLSRRIWVFKERKYMTKLHPIPGFAAYNIK